jgi:DNA-directed RNA polymerase subunit RPC12/RpoP
MPIPFTCECGKQLQAKEEFAGRRIKCPACQRLLTIPAAPAAVTVAAVEPVTVPAAAPPVAAGPIRFSCRCGKWLQADASKVGRPLRCPGCGATMTVPAHSETPPPVRRVPAPSMPRADGFLEQHLTPWQAGDAERFGGRDWESRDRRRADQLGGLLAVLLALAVGIAGLAWLNSRVRARHQQAATHEAVDWEQLSDGDLLPRDAGGLVSVPVAELWKSELGQKMRRRWPKAVGLFGLSMAGFGLEPKDIQRLTLVVPPLPLPTMLKGEQSLWFFSTTQPYDRRRLQEVLTGTLPAKGSSQPTAYFLKDQKTQVAFLNSRVFVLGDATSMAWYLSQPPRPKAESRLHEAFQALAQPRYLVVALAPVEWNPLRSLPPQAKKGFPGMKLEDGPKGPIGIKGPGGPKGKGGPKGGPGGMKGGNKENAPVYSPPPPADLKKELPPSLRPLAPVVRCRLALLTADANLGLHLQLKLFYLPAETAEAKTALTFGLREARKRLALLRQAPVGQMDLPQAILSAAALVGSPMGPLNALPGLLTPSAPQAASPTAEAAALAEALLHRLHQQATKTELHLSLTINSDELDRALTVIGQLESQLRPARPPARLQPPQEQP